MIQVSVNRKSVTEMQAQYDQMGIFVGAATALRKRFLVIFLSLYLDKYDVSMIQW